VSEVADIALSQEFTTVMNRRTNRSNYQLNVKTKHVLICLPSVLLLYVLYNNLSPKSVVNVEEKPLCIPGLEDITADNKPIPNLAIYVSSSHKHRERREGIRKSWKKYIHVLNLERYVNW
jgi:hypothetical protein